MASITSPTFDWPHASLCSAPTKSARALALRRERQARQGRDLPPETRGVGLAPPDCRVTIGDVCDQLAITPRAVRHYEMLGLIQCERGTSNSRELDAVARRRLRIIVDLRAASVPIANIAKLMEHEDDLEAARDDLLRARMRQLAEEQTRIALMLSRGGT